MISTLLTDDAPLDPDDELLVAYVDGELESDLRSRLEDRLLAEEGLRRRLQELQQGWDLLDEFPSTTPCEKLVESTLELVVADLAIPHADTSRPRFAVTRFRWPLITLLLSGVAALVAAGSIYAVRATDYQSQLEDLAIAENIDAYYYGRDLQLMRDLALNDSWTKMITAMKEIGDLSPPKAMVATVKTSEREDAIETLSLVERAQLDSRWKRFTSLPEPDQQRIRETADAVRSQPDADAMLETMQAYSAWRETLSSDLRDKIESDQIEERREAIKQAIDQTQYAVSKRSSLNLSDDSIERIAFALHQILKQRLADGDQATTRSIARLTQFTDTKRAEMITIGAIVFGDMGRGDMRNGRFGFARGPGGRGSAGPGSAGRGSPPSGNAQDRPAPLTVAELSSIEIILSDTDRDLLNSIAGDPRNPMMETVTLRYWAEETVRRKAWSREEDASTLLQRYEQMDAHDRDVIDLLPPKQMLDRLTPPARRSR